MENIPAVRVGPVDLSSHLYQASLSCRLVPERNKAFAKTRSCEILGIKLKKQLSDSELCFYHKTHVVIMI